MKTECCIPCPLAELNQKCLEKDKALSELQSQAEKWAQDQVELETLRQAYQSLQGAQEKQFESFRVSSRVGKCNF